VTHHRISLTAKGSESLAEHPTTTMEVQELMADLKVLGKTDLTKLLKWRMKIFRERDRAEKAARKKAQAEAAGDDKKTKKGGDAKSLANDVDDAIAELLEEDGGKKPKGKEQAGSDDEDEATDEELEQELAEQVEKRRREERRDAKKTMERQKKAEWKRKMSLGVTKQAQDQPELFKRTAKAEFALENQDDYLDASKLDSGAEDSDDEEGDQEDSSDSDGELDRLAKMEVDVAVDQQLRRMRAEDKFRTAEQRKRRQKKETRRQRVVAAWAGEMNAFSAAIDQKAADEHALKDKGSDDDEDFDSEDDLVALRELQETGEKGSGALDGDALEALANGPPGEEPDEDAEDGDEDEDGEGEEGEGKAKKERPMSTALVPVDHDELKAEHRMERWFSQDIFKPTGGGATSSKSNKLVPLDRDSDEETSDDDGGTMQELDDNQLPKMPLTDKERRKLKRKREDKKAEKQGKKQKTNEEDAGPMEVAPLEAPKPLVTATGEDPLRPSDPRELAQTLALGSVLAESKKSRMDIIDAAYNRWAFERDDLLPDWFTEEEGKYNKPELPVSKELMAQFRAKLREINARPIRKVTEARARKKRRLNKRLEKLRSTAMSLADQSDMSEHAKAKQMRKAVRKLAKQDERKVTVVAIKKGGGGKRMEKKAPKGAKVKVVDKRMKSDLRGAKKAAARNKSKQKVVNKKQAKKKQAKAGSRRGAK